MSSVVRRGRPGLVAVAAAVGVLAVAGCSSSSSTSTAHATGSASASAGSGNAGSTTGTLPTGSMTPLAAASGQLTGTQLEQVLLPASDFPSGYAASASGPVTSGGTLTTQKATYNLATVSCATFVQHFGTVGFGESAMVSGSVAAGYQAFDQLIYQFATAQEATSFVSGVQGLGARCASFTLSANGQSGALAIKTSAGPAVGGHQTVNFTETGKLGTSKVDLDLLLSASGVDVFAAGGVGTSGSAAPTEPSKESLVWNLMKRQAAVAELN